MTTPQLSSSSFSSAPIQPQKSSSSPYLISQLQVPCVYYDASFLSQEESIQYYNELRSLIPWEISTKINRYVYLCHNNNDDDSNNNSLSQQENQDDYTCTGSSINHHDTASIHSTTTGDNTMTSTKAKASTHNATDVDNKVSEPAAIAAANTATTTTTKSVSMYQYRDAPITFHNNNNNNNMNHHHDGTPNFPTIVREIGQRAEEWYYQNIQQQQSSTKPYNDENDDNTNTNTNHHRIHFNVCLLNYYQNGQQRIGFHSDREEIGRTTPVISISLGTSRTFYIRAKSNAVQDRTTILLQSGSLVCMENTCQQYYVHAIPKESHIMTGRINLTFRCKVHETMGEIIHARHNHWLHDMMMTEQQLQQQVEEERELHDDIDTDPDGANNDGMTTKASKSIYKKMYTNRNNTNGWSLASSSLSLIRQNQHDPVHNNHDGRDETYNDNDDEIIERRNQSTGTPYVFGDNVISYPMVMKIIPSTIQFLIKTNLGAECYSAAEIMELFGQYDDNHSHPTIQQQQDAHPISLIQMYTIIARPCNLDGYVGIIRKVMNANRNDTDNDGKNDDTISSSINDLVSQLLVQNIRSAHHVLLYHDHFHLSDCCPLHQKEEEENALTNIKDVDGEMIYQYCKDRFEAKTLTISTLTSCHNNNDTNPKRKWTFRVSCERIGMGHQFRAPDVEREIGGAISEYYSNSCIPAMEDYDIHIRADVIGSIIVIGTQLNVHDLSKERHFLRYRNAVTLKTNIAYAMIRCANIKKGDRIADPFCGSGTLLLEALDMYDKQLSCIGLDVSKRSVVGSRKNADAEQCTIDMCQFVCADARSLRRHLPDNTVDAIVSNLPWGVMTGHKNVADLQTMYEIFLRNAWYVLKPNARIVMFVLRGLQVTRIIRKLSGRYRLLNVNVIRTANNLPCIIVIEKLVTDEVRDSIKGQLMHLNQFVNVSPEIYNAIHTETIDET